MAWFSKKSDPISDRQQALNQEIAELEAQIKKLDGKLQRDHSGHGPVWRSTALPQSAAHKHPSSSEPSSPPAATPHEPIFEQVDQNRLIPRPESLNTPEHYNELGVRKYDLPALLRRIRNQFRGPSTTNPKLVSYLAAGGIQGLRPLRYEKRVARKRFLALVIFLFLIILGIVMVFMRHH